ncbi:hypothetical protein CFP56_023363 [Quercus suber]|uniref:Uncharacterized protein n=1 Tax=Quercus suber TaxID=58331 RepID=A0AAW0K8X9_QUESU
MGYLKKRRFGTLYKGLVSISLDGALSVIVDLTLILCLSWRAPSPSIESSNSLLEKFPPSISCHASCFSESIPRHGMALFLVLFNRCRVPLFPVRESPSALSGQARILMSGWLFKRLSLYPLHLHLFESLDPFFWIFISPILGAKPLQ